MITQQEITERLSAGTTILNRLLTDMGAPAPDAELTRAARKVVDLIYKTHGSWNELKQAVAEMGDLLDKDK